MSTGTCGAVNPDTAAHCVFGVGHAVQYHHGTDGVNWPVTSGFPAPVAPAVVELAQLVQAEPTDEEFGELHDRTIEELGACHLGYWEELGHESKELFKRAWRAGRAARHT